MPLNTLAVRKLNNIDMPFKSDIQKRWMYANKPEMAKEWSAKEDSEETFNGAVNNALERKDKTQFKVTVFELENGNGYQYAINGHAAQPNIDIGETHENQLGYDTKEEALHAGRGRAAWMSDMESQSRATGEWPSDPYG